MNKNFSYALIFILAVNILAAIWLLNTVQKSRETLEQEILTQATSIQNLQLENQKLQDSVLLRASYSTSSPTSFFPFAQTIWFKNKLFDVFIVDTKTCKLELFLEDGAGAPLLSFARLKDFLSARQDELLFAMNAGMYQPGYQPQGLFVSSGKQVQALDLSSGNGNFYLKPNGVFFITKDNNAHVVRSEEYATSAKDVLLATQSGPMLLNKGSIHPEFREGSSNLNIRNGVGVISSDLIVFAISRQEVNFYDFAQLFRDRLGCEQALYLDGVISRMYLPALNRNDLGGQLGPMIAVFKDKALNQ